MNRAIIEKLSFRKFRRAFEISGIFMLNRDYGKFLFYQHSSVKILKRIFWKTTEDINFKEFLRDRDYGDVEIFSQSLREYFRLAEV